MTWVFDGGIMSVREVSFWVPGFAKTAGSKRGFYNKKKNRVIIVDDCTKTKPWQADVKNFAYQAMNGQPMMEGPLELIVVFQMDRPKGHYRTGANAHMLRNASPRYPDVTPDATKLVRAVEDAMTKVVWRDDAQVVDQLVRKRYGEPGCMITVR
jgi:Holliday junction resolvase RusA-like endonuclease